MKKYNIENSIKRAIGQMPSLDFDKIASKPLDNTTQYIDHVIPQKKKFSKKLSLIFVYCFAAALICFAGIFDQFIKADSILTLDVNPSVEIVLNKQNHILSLNALNEDAEKIIKDIDYKNIDLDKTIDTILNSMIEYGYLSNDKNVIMISVENNNLKKASKLVKLVNNDLRISAHSHNLSLSLLNKVFATDEITISSAKKYNISVGKMILINKILSLNNIYSIDNLIDMPINELLLICEKNDIALEEFIEFNEENVNDSDNLSEDDTEEISPYDEPSNQFENNDNNNQLNDKSDESKDDNQDEGDVDNQDESDVDNQDEGDNNDQDEGDNNDQDEGDNNDQDEGNNNDQDEGDVDNQDEGDNNDQDEDDSQDNDEQNHNDSNKQEDTDSNDENEQSFLFNDMNYLHSFFI